ncbi:MAG: RecX family transcriptional regulator, partial [Rhodospirillales bacterium]
MAKNREQPRKPKKSKPRRADEATLMKAALAYLERYGTSRDNLRRVLMQRLERAARAYGTDRQAGTEIIESILDRCEAAGVLDDERYARRSAETYLASGESLRAIRSRLARKGVALGLIEDAVNALRSATPQPDVAAAIRLARRRRLGPYRPPANREKYRDKDLGVLARAGFSFGLARKIVEAEDEETL